MNINEQTERYIQENADADVRQLALRKAKDAGVDMTVALQQIAGRQAARRKLPTWATVDGIIYPPHLNMEQCSSEQTARYKAAVAERLLHDSDPSGLATDGAMSQRMVDLTGGFGVDFFFMSQNFAERIYVEQNPELCAISSGNFRLLDHPCSVVCGSAAAFLATMKKATLIYLDPARRDEHGGRTYALEDCTPNVIELLPLLLQKANHIILKLSPMLDWHKAVSDIQQAAHNGRQVASDDRQAASDASQMAHVNEVHVVSVDNECKELLLVLSPSQAEGLRLVCANNNDIFECTIKDARNIPNTTAFNNILSNPLPTEPSGNIMKTDQRLTELNGNIMKAGAFLYEPNASIMKAGCFDALMERFAVVPVAANSHLFLSPDEIGSFPGRRFQILAVSSMNKKELAHSLSSLERANISVRNFPLSASQLRKKLKLKDGGDSYIFATTISDGSHRLFICRKIC